MKSSTYFSLRIFCFVLGFPISLSYSDSFLDDYQFELTDNNADASFRRLPIFRLKASVETNVTVETPIISTNCSLAFETFSNSIVNFTRCSLVYARPVRICMNCVSEYRASEAAYNDLKQQNAECQQYFFSSDQLGVVDMVYKDATDIWVKSFCQNCFDNYNETLHFFNLSNDLVSCIDQSNKSISWSANSTCEECRPIYANLSSAYHRFVLERDEFDEGGGICMDIVDSMNISRRTWGQFRCSAIFESSIGFLNILTALTVGATPVMFYLMAKSVSHLEDVKLVRPKRKSTAAPPAEMPN